MKSWEDVSPDPLTFTIKGKQYSLPEIGYKAMLTIQRVRDGDTSDLAGLKPAETWRLVLGTLWDELVADDAPVPAINRAGLAALTFFQTGSREQAEQVWEKGVDPKAVAEAAALLSEQQKPRSTGGAARTPRPASTSGTSSRPAGAKRAARKKA